MILRAMASAAILASVPLAPVQADTARTSRHAGDPEYSTRVICRVSPSNGSRLGTTRTCKTRAEWDQFARDQRNSVERFQAFTPGCAMGSNVPGQGNMPVVCGSEH